MYPHGLAFAALSQSIKYAFCVLFLGVIAYGCYRHPVPDDFDRYIYEAIVRGWSQPVEVVYPLVKHESPRAEESSVLQSPEDLRALEPLYAIRPLYLFLIAVVSHVLPIQRAITLISAASLFGIGVVVLCWTRTPLLAALLMAASPILVLGRIGTPDGLAALLAILSLYLMDTDLSPLLGLGVLFMSLGVRTDNILLLLPVLAWVVHKKRLGVSEAGLGALLAVGVVLVINHLAGNYGWIVLFRYSFLGGRSPAGVSHSLTLLEYVVASGRGVQALLPRLAIWLLLGSAVWWRTRSALLAVVGFSVAAHIALYPSPEDRYLAWAYVIVGVATVRFFLENLHQQWPRGEDKPFMRHGGSIGEPPDLSSRKGFSTGEGRH
jgi:hypothetical protein